MENFLNKKVIIIDGSLAAELKKFDFDFENDVFWTAKALIEKPELMKQIHKNFLKNGADIIETCSYQINQSNLMKYLKIDTVEAKKFLKRSVEIAIEARKETNFSNALIAGSVGPYGASLHDRSEYSGLYANEMTIDELIEWHRPRVEALVEAGVDLLAFETIPSIKEGLALCELLKQYPNHLAWLSFSCKNESQLCIGDSFQLAYQQFRHNSQLIAIGINCTNVKYITKLLETINEFSTPFIIYPNDGSFVSYLDLDLRTNDSRPAIDYFIDIYPSWIKLGCKFIGGCCGFVAEDIKKLKESLNQSN